MSELLSLRTVSQGMSRILFVWVCLLVLGTSMSRAQVASFQDPDLARIDIVEHLGDTLPRALSFRDESGASVTLADYFSGDRPVLLSLGYYKCPMLCNLVMNGMSKATKELDWTPGVEYRIVTVSINPLETPELAAAKKQSYVVDFGRSGVDTGWAFLTGTEDQISQLTAAVGFNYFYDTTRAEYAHAAAIYAISPDGMISRYLYGIEFPARDLKLALMEASDGKTGSAIDKLLLYCFHYDPASKGYAPHAANLMKAGGVVTMAAVGFWLFGLVRRGSREQQPPTSGSASRSTHEVSHG